MDYLYLLATLLFVFGIKRLTSIRTCAQGNRLSEAGMLVAVVSTLLIYGDVINDPASGNRIRVPVLTAGARGNRGPGASGRG